jgi:hypothetical protein
LPLYLLQVKSNVGVEINDTSRTKKKEARHASPLVVLVEATPMLRFPHRFVIFFLTHGSFCKIFVCNYQDIVSVHHIVVVRVI